MIDAIAHPHIPRVGENYTGKVVKTTSFGAFVNLTPGVDGLLHISQLRNLRNGDRIERVEDVVKEGDEVDVIIGDIDTHGKISLVVPVAEESLEDMQDENEDFEEDVEAPARSSRRSSRCSDREYDRSSRRHDDYDRSSDRRSSRFDRDDEYDRSSNRRSSRRSDRDRSAHKERFEHKRSEQHSRRSEHDEHRFSRSNCHFNKNREFTADDANYREYRDARNERAERPRRRIVHRDFNED